MKLIEALISRKLVQTEAEARGLILAGKVLVNDVPVTKPGSLVKEEDAIRTRGIKQFVSRSGQKLDAALDAFAIPVTGRSFLDIGASTGGFTDVLLQRGAAFVAAIDVGKGLLHQKIRTDARVQVLEGHDIKNLDPRLLKQNAGAFVADVSFASLETIIPGAFSLLKPDGRPVEAIVLFKPQFELARDERHLLTEGILQDSGKSAELLSDFELRLRKIGLSVAQSQPAAVKGRKGNQEYVLHIVQHKTLLIE